MSATPDGVVVALGRAIATGDEAAARALATASGWDRSIAALYGLALRRKQSLVTAGPATVRGDRAVVPSALLRPERAPARVLVLTERVGEGWRAAGADSERAVIEAWLRGYIEAGIGYRDLPASPLGVAIAARVVAAVEGDGDVLAALGDRSPGGDMAAAMLTKALAGRHARVSALPSREHPRLGRVAVGFEVTDLATLGREELWLVMEDRGDGARALATVSFMSLALLLGDHGGGLPTPVANRSEAPAPPVLGDAFERAVLAAARATTSDDEGDLFERATRGTDDGPDPWARLAGELERGLGDRAATPVPNTDEEARGDDWGAAPDPLMRGEELRARLKEALSGYLAPYSPETKAAPEFVREHAQGLIGAAFQAIVPALRRALTPTDPDRAGE